MVRIIRATLSDCSVVNQEIGKSNFLCFKIESKIDIENMMVFFGFAFKWSFLKTYFSNTIITPSYNYIKLTD